MKQYPHILTYTRSLTRTMNLDICVHGIPNNTNFYIQPWYSIPNYLPGWRTCTSIYL